MPLTLGTQLGSHEITALLGKGGMGEVYRARDLKLKREVAIKILPNEFASDSDRVIRFQREAEVLASLIHPNIAGIYDIQESKGTRFLILELVEGETLADHIARGPIPVGEALAIAIQICEALEAAHEKGIVHRDLKPANVKLTPEGKVKVLDFGLAKVMDRPTTDTDLSNSPTLITGTMAVMIMGTASYLSPEQARGRPADPRSDIFAFGCVLYEMLTGHQAFHGEDASDMESAKPFVQEFVDFEMEPKFLSELESKIKAFTQAVADHMASRSAHAATTQLIDAAMERALISLAQLDPIMENKLGSNTALQLKWENVRRVEKRWIYKTPKEKTPLVPAA